MTVDGPVPPEQLGSTLIHEHLWLDATPLLAMHGYASDRGTPFDARAAAEARWNPGCHPENYRLTDLDLAVEEVRLYLEAGGRTIVDVTPSHLGRNPTALQSIAKRTGVQVIMGGGFYLEPTLPAGFETRSSESITSELIGEWQHGVGDTGVRPGILGEFGTGTPPTATELRVLRAAGDASLATGLSITIHLHPWGRTGQVVVDLLVRAGVAPERIVLNHLNTAYDDERYLRTLVDSGVFVAFDLFGFDHSLLGLGRFPPSDADVALTVARLARGGHAGQILLSQDIGVRTRYCAYGGWGYGHLLRHVVPLLTDAGLEDVVIQRLLVTNPGRVLTVRVDGS